MMEGIEFTSRPFLNEATSFQPLPFNNKRVQQIEFLRQKLNDLRQRTSQLFQQTEWMTQEQVKMNQTALVIHKNQEDIQRLPIVLKERTSRVKRRPRSVQENPASLRLTLGGLMPFSLSLGDFMPFRPSQEKAHLQQRIVDLQQRMARTFQQAEGICKEQEQMHQTAWMIQKDHEEMECKQIVIKQKQESMRLNSRLIQANHASMKSSVRELTQTWISLFQQALDIQSDQLAVSLKLERIEQKRMKIHQTAVVIRRNNEGIRHSLKDAAQRGNQIEQKANVIEQRQECMQLKVRDIEQKRHEIYQKMPLIQQPYIKEKKDLFPQFEIPAQAEGETRAETKTSFSFWSLLLNKIHTFAMQIMANLVHDWAQARLFIKKHVSDYQWTLMSNVLMHPVTRLSIEMIACIALQSVKLSFLFAAIEGTFIYLQKNHKAHLFVSAEHT
jgi:hypothetical protein